ncbi:MAG: hypothetical protein ACM3TU_00170 [Bacillota bacterium]
MTIDTNFFSDGSNGVGLQSRTFHSGSAKNLILAGFSAQLVLGNGTANFNTGTKVGIGTTSPYAPLSVVGQIVGAYFTATTSTASTFPYASTTALTVSGEANIGSLAGASVSSLTSNYLPKWNSGTFANSLVYDNGTNAGVGTTSPWAYFSINPNGNAGPSFVIGSSSATSTFVVTNGGSVGIGTTTPNVNTGLSISRTDTSDWIRFEHPGTRTYGINNTGAFLQFLDRGSAGNTGTTIFTIGNSSGTNNTAIGGVGVGSTSPTARFSVKGNGTGTGRLIAFADSADTERLTVLDNGSVGIGTTSPWAQLSVNPNGVSGPAFAIGSSTATNFIVTNSGSVGIGTSNPTALLSLGGQMNWVTGLGAITHIVGPTDNTFAIAAGNSTSGAGNAFTITGSTAASGTGGAITITTGLNSGGSNQVTGALTLGTANGTGSGSYGGPITIAVGSAVATANSGPANASGITITAGTLGSVNQSGATGGTGGPITITSGAGAAMANSTGVRAGNGGNLTVTGGAGGNATASAGGVAGAGAWINLTSGAGGSSTGTSGTRTGGDSGGINIFTGAAGTGASSNGAAGAIVFGIGGVETARFATTTGYFGLGTTSPAKLLSVAGNAYITGSLTLDTALTVGNGGTGLSTAPTYGQVLVGNASGGYTLTATSSLGISGTNYWTSSGSDLYNNTGTEIGINTTAPAYALDVAGFINTDQYSGYKQAGNTILYASSTRGTTLVGISAGAALTTSSVNVVAVGKGALQYSTASNNTALGYQALNVDSTGDLNVAVGTYALASNDTGAGNVAIGYGASYNTAPSVGTVAIGQEAANGVGGSYSSTGSVAIGYRAGYNFYNSSNYNTLLGYQSGFNITTGANNIIIGADSGTDGANSNLTSGSNNIQIGYNISLASSTGSNQLNIGNLIYGTGLNGTGSTPSAGYVGIGTSSPSSQLEIASTTGPASLALSGNSSTQNTTFLINDEITALNKLVISLVPSGASNANLATVPLSGLIQTSSGSTGGLILNAKASAPIIFATGGSALTNERLRIDSAGKVGIGTTSPSQLLSVQGNTFLSGNITNVANITATGTLNIAGAITSTATSPNTIPYASTTALTVSGQASIASLAGAAVSSLTANYLPKWNSGTWANSTVYDTGTKVGIGTTTPGTQLHISSASAPPFIKVTNDGEISVDESYGGLQFEGMDVGGSGVRAQIQGIGEGVNGQAGLAFSTMGGGAGSVSERLRITNAGYVGIGTTSPWKMLSIAGDVMTTGKVYAGADSSRVLYVPDQTNFIGSFFLGDGGDSLSHTTGQEGQYNTGVGLNTLNSLTKGTFNTALGQSALHAVTTGTANTALGQVALFQLSTGSDNTAVGRQTQYNLQTGSFNTSLGYLALYQNSTGSNNTAIGTYAGMSSVSQDLNNEVLLGYKAGISLTTGGDNNTLLGYQAGYGVTSGTYNVIIGNYGTSGGITTGSNNILIGEDVRPASTTDSNQLNVGNLLYGTGLGSGTTAGTGNIGVGSSSPYAKLSITNTGSAPSFLVEDSTSPDTSPFIIDASGNVGIGTSSPLGVLQVNGTISAGTAGTYNGYYFVRNSLTSGQDREVALGAATYNTLSEGNGVYAPVITGVNNNLGTYAYYLGYKGLYASTTSSGSATSLLDGTNAVLFLGVNTDGSTYFNAGNVGIGSTTPYAKLSVKGAGTGTGVTFQTTNSSNSPTFTILDNGTITATGAITSSAATASTFPYASTTALTVSGQANIGSLAGAAVSSLTTNYLPKWNSGTFANSLVYDTGTNVGIGTTTPASLFTLNSTAAGALQIYRNAGAIASLQFTNTAGSMHIGIDADADFAIRNVADIDTANYFIIKNTTGNIGIGTTSPLGKLDIYSGASTVSAATSAGDDLVIENSSSAGISILTPDTTGVGGIYFGHNNDNDAGRIVYNNSDDSFDIFNSGSQTVKITNTGNVGIGTTSPWAKLHAVGAGGDASLAVGTQNAVGKYTVGNTSLDIGRNNSSPFGWYLQSRFDNAATAGPLLLNPLGGNVGIGTTSPYAPLSVVGQVVGAYFTATTTTASTFPYASSTALTVSGQASIGSFAGAAVSGLTTNYLPKWNGGAFANSLVYDTGTNVGIGTATPATTLQVHGQSLWLTGGDGSTLGAAAGAGLRMYYNTSTGAANIFALDYGTSVSKDIILQSPGGKVGIGTTTPSSLLSVSGSSGLFLTNTGTGPTLYIEDAANDTTPFTITAAGNVGVGTSTPAAQVSIGQASNGARAFEIFDTGSSPSTNTALFYRQNNIGAGNASTSNALLRVVDNGANYPFSVESTTGAPLFTINGNTSVPRVGVGSSSPYATLSVKGAGSTTGLNFQTTNSSATPLFSIYDSGNVAIGTTTATQKLTLAGNILGYADTPTLVGGTGTLTGSLDAAQGVAVQGRYAYVVAGGVADDLAIIDVSQPASPVIVGTTTAGALGGDSGDVVVNGNYAYVAVTAVDRLSVVDVSDPSHPTVVGSVTSSTQLDGITNLTLNGQYLYITSSVDDLISVVDVSDPTHPVILASKTPGINDLNDAQDIVIQGNYAFVTSRLGGDGLPTSAHLAVFDVTNPADPQLVATTTSTTEMNDARGLYASGRYLYVGSLAGDALVIYDISNPRAPVQVGALTDATNLNGAFYVKVRGNYAYVSVNVADGIAVVDVSNPTAPTYVTSYTASSGTGTLDGSYRFDMLGQYLYGVSNLDDAFTILNVGSYLPAASIGNLAAQKLDILDNVSIGSSVKVGGALNLAGSFQNYGGINTFVTSTSTTAGTMQGINSLLLGKGIVTTGTDTTYNVFASTTRIGATGGTINTYGGYFTVTGDTGGTSQAVGLYASASGADSNYAAIFANGNVGIGTTSPSSLLSIQGNALFSGNLTLANLTATGTASIATLTLTNALTVANGGTGATTFTSNGILYGNGTSAVQVTAAGAAGTVLTGTGGAPAFSATPTLTSLTAATIIGGTAAGSTLTLKSTSGTGTTDAILFLVGNNGATEAMRIISNGNVGIGTTTPGSRLSVQQTASAAQFSIAYDTTRYANLQVDSSGDFIMDAQGQDIRHNDDNLWVCSGGACPAGTPAGTGNLLVETALGIGSSSPSGANLAIAGTAGTASLWIGSSSAPLLIVDKNGSLGIGTSTPWSKFSLATGAVTVAEQTLATSTSMTIDWRNGNQQLIRIGTAGTTISFSGYTAGERLMLTICNPNATAGAISWGTAILWSGGAAPAQTTTANKCDIWSFVATNATSTIKILGAQTPNF